MTATTKENVTKVKELRQSQEEKPRTRKSQHQAVCIISVSQSIALKKRRLYQFKSVQFSNFYSGLSN